MAGQQREGSMIGMAWVRVVYLIVCFHVFTGKLAGDSVVEIIVVVMSWF